MNFFINYKSFKKMKTKKMLFWGVGAAVAALMSFASCSSTEPEFKLNTTQAVIEVGEQITITAQGVTEAGAVVWAKEGTGFEITPNAGQTELTVIGEAVGGGTITATYKGKTLSCMITVVAPEIELPELPAPAAGHATVAIHIPAGTSCFGIVFKGTNDGWSTVPEVAFEAIEGYENWYSVDLTLGEGMDDAGTTYKYYGKACLLPEEGGVVDVNWTTQWKDGQIELLQDNDQAIIGCGGEGNKLGIMSETVAYINVKQWQSVPCVPDQDYTVTFTAPACTPEDATVYMIGSFAASAWGTAVPMELGADGKWTLTVAAQATSEYKFRISESDWSDQLQEYSIDEATQVGTWNDCANNSFGDDLNITFDASDAAKYKWASCEAPVE